MMYQIFKVLGLDDPGSAWYLGWSGIVGDLGVLSAVWVFYAKHNCHRRHCWRIGKHVYDGTPYCTRHHPSGEK